MNESGERWAAQMRLFEPSERPARSIYEEIDMASSFRSTVEACVPWLHRNSLLMEGRSYRPPDQDTKALLSQDGVLLQGLPCHRAEKQRSEDLKRLKAEHKGRPIPGLDLDSKVGQEALWTLFKSPRSHVIHLYVSRMPADAVAFYRPFHFLPCEEWGVYLLVDKLLNHCDTLMRLFGRKLVGFSEETLIACVLFEVFHHEFFHHMVESTATTIEIVFAGIEEPRPIYRQYWESCYRRRSIHHPHDPLEEAFANAYAFNSFGFLLRVKPSFGGYLAKVYQEIVEKCWPMEGEGYRSAGFYKGSRYISGAAQLLAMLLPSQHPSAQALLLLADKVMPAGHATLAQKSEVPTYLVGDDASLRWFHELVPAPNETYTSLFTHLDTDPIDDYLRKRSEEERKARAEAKAKTAQGAHDRSDV